MKQLVFGFKTLKPGEARVPVPPAHNACVHCGEFFEEGDCGEILANHTAMHHECAIRGAAGSVGHQRRECSCFGGQGNGDPEGVSVREAARQACIEFYQRQGRRWPEDFL